MKRMLVAVALALLALGVFAGAAGAADVRPWYPIRTAADVRPWHPIQVAADMKPW